MVVNLESAQSARQAVELLLAKQQADLDSFNIRAGLHLANLEKARCSASAHLKLEATVNMVNSFLGSANLFRIKWANQVARLKDRYPQIVESPMKSGLVQLEMLPEGLAAPEQQIRAALAAI